MSDTHTITNLQSMVAAMQMQIWVLTGLTSVFFIMSVTFVRWEWLGMRKLLAEHGKDIQHSKERWANYDGGKTVAQSVIDGCEILATTIDKKHKR